MDDFMDRFIQERESTSVKLISTAAQVVDPLEEFDRYFSRPCVDRTVCVDLVAWWGVS
jgi:hypothetical protein